MPHRNPRSGEGRIEPGLFRRGFRACPACGVLLLILASTCGAEEEPPVAGAQVASEPLRMWTDLSGKYRTQARLVSANNGTVRLRREDGKEITLPAEKLSVADQLYLSLSRRSPGV